MATLRLFANLRECAGTSSAEVAGETVGAVLGAAVQTYGAAFAEGLSTARVWVNGEPADDETVVTAQDEIALIPPVSGGAAVMTEQSDLTRGALVLTLLGAVVVGNLVSVEMLVFAIVGATLAWLWDVRDALLTRNVEVAVIPVMITVAVTANSAYRWGLGGFAAGLAVGFAVILSWAVVDLRARTVEALSLGLLLTAITSVTVGGLVLIRIAGDQRYVTVYLVVAFVAGVSSWAAHRMAADVAGVDPNVAAIVGALISAVLLGFFTDVLTLSSITLAALAVGAGVVGGRTLGSMLRTGSVIHTERAPGLLTIFDGAYPAAALYWVSLTLFG